MTTSALFIVVALAGQAASAGSRYLAESVGLAATNRLRHDLALHCLRLDPTFHKTRTPGEMIERIDGDTGALSAFFAQFVVGVLANAVLLVGIVVLLYRVDVRVGLAMTAFVVVALAVLWLVRGLAVPHFVAVRQARAEFFGFLGEVLSGTEDIRANGAVPWVMSRFHAALRRWFPLQRRAEMAGYAVWMASIFLFALGTAGSLALSAYLYFSGAVTIGTVYLIYNYTQLIRRPLEQIRTYLQELQRAEAAWVRVGKLLATRSRVGDPGEEKVRRLPAGPLSVIFDRVTFAYDENGEPALDEVEFRVEPGRVLGLLGRTGSGKTTVARLLFRLYDPTRGRVELGGLDIRDVRLDDLRCRVGLVTQDVQLFHASVRDNLTFFRPEAPDDFLLAVLDEVGLGEWLRALPDGLDTVLSPGGSSLSAGEAQLLAFARLLLRDPGLVVLDEASSRLDPLTERRLERAMRRALDGRTGVVIAHRLETLSLADDILILEDGRVVEHGERVSLARDPDSHFARLLRTGLEEVLA